ncbi:MAG: hypothetical protein J6P48_01155 [Oscillospiraceae bacterium]|nr:hypothetical protein [Oscillospiraceae bacterium]
MKNAVWICKTHLFEPDEYFCSACGAEARRAFRFCPVCGARMARTKSDLTWLDEAEELDFILDDDDD